MKRWGWVLVCMFLVVAFTACSKGKTEEKSKTEKQTAPKTETKAPEKEAPKKPENIYPLTGLEAKNKAETERRAVAVMVNNFKLARPQSGLHKADIVYEALAEGRITRFLAVFQSQKPDVIGPIRSARPYYIELSKGFDAIYIAHGWSPQAKKILTSGGIDYIQGLYHDGTWFHRASFRKAPHNSYIPYSNVVKGAKTKNYDLTKAIDPLPFYNPGDKITPDGGSVSKATVIYDTSNVVSYVYNKKDEKFYRHINGEQAKDRETGTPLTADNVFIISAKHRFIDSYPRRAIDLKSGGDAYLLQKGKLMQVQWKNVDGRILPYKDGKALKFVPGQTWVNIIPSDEGFSKDVKIDK